MATKARTPRQPKVYPDEQAIEHKMEPLQKKKKDGKELTEKETEQLAGYRKELGALRFKRIAKQRFAKAAVAIRNLGKLGGAGYTRTEEQVKTLSDNLNTELKGALAALNPSKEKGAKATITIEL